jgi:hypothetical protein
MEATAPGRRFPFLELALGLAGLGAVLALHWLPDLPLCFFKASTGLDCPTCGTTRSVYALLHGHFAQAWRYNPTGYLVLVFALRHALLWLPGEGAWKRFLAAPAWIPVMLGALVAFGLDHFVGQFLH